MLIKSRASATPRGRRWWAGRIMLAASSLIVVGLAIVVWSPGGSARGENGQQARLPDKSVEAESGPAGLDCTAACTPAAVMDSGLGDPFTPTRPAPTPAPKPTPTVPLSQVEFTLQTLFQSGKMLYIGVGGAIDGVINPTLEAAPGAVVRAILVNGDGMSHDLYFPDFEAKTDKIGRVGETAEVTFTVPVGGGGTYVYYCTLPGHRAAGQEGQFVVR
jgi:nitrite reductase (NO-forming)